MKNKEETGHGDNYARCRSVAGDMGVVAVFLLIYVVKSNEQRDKRQEERENNYQSVIEKLTEKYQILYTVQNDLNEIKNHLLAKQDSRSE